MEKELVVTTGQTTQTTDGLVDEALALGEDLDRPLRYVQLNSFFNGSTGSIMRRLHRQLQERGVDSYIFWGRRHESINDHEQCCATKLGYLSHGFRSRLTDRMGFYSKRDTARLLGKLERIDPDVVHLHNVHGYYVNIEMLFNWLAAHRCQVRWTLHDCWAFTGHCSHFTYSGCEQWRFCCGNEFPCPEKRSYPKSILLDSCKRNYDDKKRLFTLVPPERMTLITPSRWLAELVKDSFLGHYGVEVANNVVDTNVFKPVKSDFRNRYGIGSRTMILGVSSPWSDRKGLYDFIELSNHLDGSFAIALVGLTKTQISKVNSMVGNGRRSAESLDPRLRSAVAFMKNHGMQSKKDPSSAFPICQSGLESPSGCVVLLFERTDSQQELVEMYSTADVFFNPTKEENYPTVNLEAEACGTPVCTYGTGGCAETLRRSDSVVING